MSYQRLFRRYHRLGGMSGTLGEVRGEMAATYGTPVVAVPRHHPSRLQSLGTYLVADERRKWATVVQRVEAMHRSERPVLVGTGSVAESELLAGLLRARGLRPLVLNAVQNTQENAVIARAGQPGRITVSTQMAGRGTDIRLDERVRALGGLHVLACGQTHNARQWRQLIGRAGPPGRSRLLRDGAGDRQRRARRAVAARTAGALEPSPAARPARTARPAPGAALAGMVRHPRAPPRDPPGPRLGPPAGLQRHRRMTLTTSPNVMP